MPEGAVPLHPRPPGPPSRTQAAPPSLPLFPQHCQRPNWEDSLEEATGTRQAACRGLVSLEQNDTTGQRAPAPVSILSPPTQFSPHGPGPGFRGPHSPQVHRAAPHPTGPSPSHRLGWSAPARCSHTGRPPGRASSKRLRALSSACLPRAWQEVTV